MIVTCLKCGTKFRLTPSTITCCGVKIPIDWRSSEMKAFTFLQAIGNEGRCKCGAKRAIVRNGRMCILRCFSKHCPMRDQKVAITNLEEIMRFTEPIPA